jgi:hypothetical protein
VEDPHYKRQLTLFKNSAKEEMKKVAPTKMSVWPNKYRAVANEIARCSLFSCRNPKTPRHHYTNERLFTLGKSVMTYSGEELRSNDQDIWLALAHAVRDYPGENIVLHITSSEICRLVGWRIGQDYYTEIYKSIQRMKATALTVFSPRLKKARAYEQARRTGASDEELASLYAAMMRTDSDEAGEDEAVSGIMMSMIGSRVLFDAEGVEVIDDIPQGNLKWTIPLDAEIVALFAWSYLTLVPYERRRKLPRGAARNLQAYFMSHQQPFPVKMSSLAKMLNLDGELRENKRTIESALNQLQKEGVLESVKIDKGRGDVLVHVVRAPEPPDDEGETTTASPQ